MMRWLLVLVLPLIMAFDTALEDPQAEAQALALMDEIRCVACENEPISQSGADIAVDMRARVREMVGEGATDTEVRAWFRSRYGDFVLFRPPTSGLSGFVLWGFPFLLLLIGGLGIWVSRRGSAKQVSAAPVTPDAFDHGNETKE